MAFLQRKSIAALITLLAGIFTSATTLAQGGRARGWLGIAMDASDSGGGVHVGHVVHGSPAAKAGVREDDRVLRVGGAIVSAPSDVIRIVSTHERGEAIELTLSRGGKQQTVSIVLASFPSPDQLVRMDTVGTSAPPFISLAPLTGFPTSLDSLRGRVVLLDFWASWCGPCRILSPVLSRWQARYAAQGLTILGVTTDAPDVAATAKESLGIKYPVASDANAATSRAYSVSALPTVFLIDKKGVVRDVSVGYDPDQDAAVEGLVRTLLAEPASDP